MGDLMHPSVDTCMLGEPCSTTRGRRRVRSTGTQRTLPFRNCG